MLGILAERKDVVVLHRDDMRHQIESDFMKRQSINSDMGSVAASNLVNSTESTRTLSF